MKNLIIIVSLDFLGIRLFTFFSFVSEIQEQFEGVNSEVEEIKRVMNKKSNIKDVCALLDTKSSKQWFLVATCLTPSSCFIGIDDVNKAFSEMHLEVEKKVYKQEINAAM